MASIPEASEPSPLQSLGLTKTQYADALLPMPPTHVVEILRNRMRQAKAVNEDIAEFFRERIAIEEAYVKNLQKLHRRQPIPGITPLKSYNAAWEQIKLHISRVASSHAALARRTATELEGPLRNFSSRDFGQLPHIEANLQSLADSTETARQKSEKAKSKGKAKKQEEKAREETDARALWETESPLILEKMQTMDEARMMLLKDIFVKCMMLEVETSQSAMSEAEGIMNSLLSLTPAREVAAFVEMQQDAPKPTLHERRRSSIMPNNQTFMPSPTASPVSRPSLTTTTSNLSVPEDVGSLRSEKRKSRFGTILRSGRNLHLRGSSPERKRKEKEKEQADRQRQQNLSPVVSQTAPNGVTAPLEPIAPIRTSSIPPIQETERSPQRSPIKEERPMSRDRDQVTGFDEGERGSIMSSDSTYAPPLRVEIQKEVIPEEAGERDAAVNILQNTLRAQSTISRKSRGRREGRNSVFANDTNEFGPMSPPIQEMSQMTISPTSMTPTSSIITATRTLSPVRYADSDTQSLSSVRTASRPSGIALHPDLETPGFNVSILESLSAILSEGKVQRIFVVGEIALSNHGRAGGIQIRNTEKLEQIVANKGFINEGGNGTYMLTTQNLPPKGAVALKYKVAIPADPQTIVPLLIRTMWKIEQGSVSLMVGYRLNPAFQGSRSMSNAAISATLPTDSRVTGCQSKPQGQFSKERGQLIWQLSSLEETEQIFLAKFSIDGLCKANGTVEAKWECRRVTVSGIEVSGVAAKDPFADEEDIFFTANVVKGLISGKYFYIIFGDIPLWGLDDADPLSLISSHGSSGNVNFLSNRVNVRAMDSVTQFIRATPKCELHLHIEGTLSPELLLRLASKNKISLPPIYSSLPVLKERYENFSDLQDFLNFYYQGIAVLQDESDYEELAFDYFRHAHADGIYHSELFFDIQTHTSRSISAGTVVNGLLQGSKRAKESFGISSDLIVCFVRHEDESSALKEFLGLEKYFESGEIIGIGLDSAELPHPPENFAQLYAEAEKRGLKKCAHAGEEGPPQYVRTAIDHLKVHRVDHGIRSIEDADLCQELARRKIPLTVCPLSNVKLQCIPSMVHSPIPQFLDHGIVVTINSDDPAYFGGYLLDNMLALQHAFGWDFRVWETLCLNGIEASFCSSERKEELKSHLKHSVENHKTSQIQV